MGEPLAVVTRADQCASNHSVNDVLEKLRAEGKLPQGGGGWTGVFRPEDAGLEIWAEGHAPHELAG